MIKKLKIGALLFLAAMLFAAKVGICQEPRDLFNDANELYKKGEYGEAAKIYEKLILADPYRAEYYYNLGNAYFKNDEIGLSVLNFERAYKLSPRDKEISGNLGFAKSVIQFAVEDKRNWYYKQMVNVLDKFSLRQMLNLSLIVFILLMLPMVIRLIRKKSSIRGRFTGLLLALFLISLVPFSAKIYFDHFFASAIVTSTNAEVRYGPSARDKISFRLVKGLKVEVADEREGWMRIKLVNGETGWVRSDSLTKI